MTKTMKLELKNPHSVLAALQRRPRDVEEIILESSGSGAWKDVESLAKRNGVRVRMGLDSSASSSGGGPQKGAGKGKKNRRGSGGGQPGGSGGRGGAQRAVVREKDSLALHELFESPADGDLWLALDCLQDPHNVGAIFRTAAFFGVRGILMMEERAASLSSTVYDVATGGVEVVPFCFETNMKQALEAAKEAGIWVLGTSEHAKDSLFQIRADRPWILVLGNEEKGVRPLVSKACDQMAQIPPADSTGVTSLNVSSAAAISVALLKSQK